MKTGCDLDANGTSWHGTIISATKDQIEKVLGPSLWGCNKSNCNWVAETESGHLFTVYDWKLYREIRPGEIVDWHIGGFNKESEERGLESLRKEIV
jgi:hypothetical protein